MPVINLMARSNSSDENESPGSTGVPLAGLKYVVRHICIFSVLTIAALSHSVALAQPSLTLPRPSIIEWMTNDSDIAQQFRQQLRQATDDLQTARLKAHGKLNLSVPTSLAQPLPESNAASDYIQLELNLHAKLLGKSTEDTVFKLSRGYLITEEEDRKIRDVFAERTDIWSIIERAVSKQQCVFERDWSNQDWSQGYKFAQPDYNVIQQAARWVCARQKLFIEEDNYRDAAKLAITVNQIAKHAQSEPFWTPTLISLAIQKDEVFLLQKVLQRGGSDEQVCLAVRQAITKGWPETDFNRALSGETSMVFATFDALRNLQNGPETYFRVTHRLCCFQAKKYLNNSMQMSNCF